MIELWSINKVLRWTGFRVVVEVPASLPPDMEEDLAGGSGSANALGEEGHDEEAGVTKIGVKWIGLYGSEGWMRWEPWTRPFWSRWRGALAAKVSAAAESLRDARDEAAAQGESAVKALASASNASLEQVVDELDASDSAAIRGLAEKIRTGTSELRKLASTDEHAAAKGKRTSAKPKRKKATSRARKPKPEFEVDPLDSDSDADASNEASDSEVE